MKQESIEAVGAKVAAGVTYTGSVGRDIAGSLHWNGNIPSLKIGKAG